MKLMSTPKDAPGVDPRSNSAPKPAADTSSNDNNSPPFDGVLADVGADAKTAQSGDVASKKTDVTMAPTTTSPTTGAASAGTAMIASFLGTLGAARGPTTGAPATEVAADGKADGQGESATTGDPNDLVDSLLKRIAAKDAPADAATAAAVPSAIPTDMMAMLLQSSSAKTASAAADKTAAATAPDPAATATVAAATLGAAAATGPAPSSSDAKETVVSDVSVSTHLAPATGVQGKASPTDDAKTVAPKPATFGESPVAPAAPAAKSAGTDDSTAPLRHNSEPSAATLGTQTISGDFGPVRSIATAIGALAAETAPAATVSDVQRPTLAVARTMTLQMNPADLGTVDVRLHITGQTLDVQLTISNQETLGMVSRDRDTLTSALHDQNYTLNSLVIQDGGAAASSGGNNAATQGNTPGGGYARPDRQNSGAAGSDTQGGGRQSQGGNQSAQGDRRSGGDPSARAAAVESRGGLFV